MKLARETIFGTIEYFMNHLTLPQALSPRYVTNLLIKGKNDEFEIITMEHQQAIHDGIPVGSFYNVIIRRPLPDHSSEMASGVTPHQAVQRTLVKFGVTFR